MGTAKKETNCVKGVKICVEEVLSIFSLHYFSALIICAVMMIR